MVIVMVKVMVSSTSNFEWRSNKIILSKISILNTMITTASSPAKVDSSHPSPSDWDSARSSHGPSPSAFVQLYFFKLVFATCLVSGNFLVFAKMSLPLPASFEVPKPSSDFQPPPWQESPKRSTFMFINILIKCLIRPWRRKYSQINMRVLFSWTSDCRK